MGNPLYSTWAWQTLSRKTITRGRTNQEPCCRCGRAIDYRLTGRHRDGPTADHLDPLAHGGTQLPPLHQLGVAHRHCNSRHGATISNAKQGLGPGSRGGNPNNYTKRSGKKIKTKNQNQNLNRDEHVSSAAESNTPRKPLPVVSGIEAVCDISTPFTADLRIPGEFDGLPLVFPGPHPEAVGSHGDAFVAAAEARMRSDPWTPGDRLRWWQWLVAQRLLEFRADGSWCWPVSFVSVPRQQGKTEFLDELAVWRASWAAAAGLLHEVGHSASTVVVSRRHQSSRWPWALKCGLEVARQLGDSQIRWPVAGGDPGTAAVWRTMAPQNMFGRALDTVLGDEAWSWTEEDFWQSTFPTIGERPGALVVFFSAAHDEPRSLVGSLIGNPDVLVMLWGAPAGADQGDRRVWRAATPFWSPARERLMAIAAGKPSFATQWLNSWPGLVPGSRAGAVDPEAWAAAGRDGVRPPRDRCVVGVSKEMGPGGAEVWPVVVAGRVGAAAEGAVVVRLLGVFGSLDEAVAAAQAAVGAGCWLVAPAFPLKEQLLLRRVAKRFWLSDIELAAGVEMCRVRLASGELVHDPADEGLTRAVLGVPRMHVRRSCGAGTLAMAAAAFAFRPRDRSAAA